MHAWTVCVGSHLNLFMNGGREMNCQKILHFITLTAWHTIVVIFFVGLILLKHDTAVAADSPIIIVQAEDYDLGGQHVAYFDKTPGNAGDQYRNDDVDIWTCCDWTFYIGTNATGEWLNYTIDAPYNGNYRLEIRVATPYSDRKMHVEFNGEDKTGPLTLPNTGGWIKWTTLSTNIMLDAGTQTMRLVIDYGGLNIDYISLTPLDGPKVAAPTFTPNGGTFYGPMDLDIESTTPGADIIFSTHRYGNSWYYMGGSVSLTLERNTTIRAIAFCSGYFECEGLSASDEVKAEFYFPESPLMIEAEDYDEGGKNVGFFDKTSGNAGGQYRNDDVDIWRYWLGSDYYNVFYGYYLGANATGEWLNYTFKVPLEGEYRLTIRVATPYDNRRLHVEFNGKNVTGPMMLPNTGGWGGSAYDSFKSWEQISTYVNLTAGQTTMRLVIENGGFNVDNFSIVHMGN